MDINFLKQHFIYNPEKGEVLRRKNHEPIKIGKNGEICIKADGKLFQMQATKLAWALHYWVIPKHKILTHNHNRRDIKLSNLKEPIHLAHAEKIKKLVLEKPHYYTHPDLMAILGVGRPAIENAIRISLPHLRPLIKRVTSNVLRFEDFNEFDTSRMTCEEIAKKFNKNPETIRRILFELNLPYKSKLAARKEAKEKIEGKPKPIKKPIEFKELKTQAEILGFRIADLKIEDKIFKPSPKINLNKKNAANFINDLKSNLFNIDNFYRYLQLNTNDVLKNTTIDLIVKELVKNGIIEQISKNSKTYKRLRQISSDEVQDFTLVKREKI